jgi:uncharacterized protein
MMEGNRPRREERVVVELIDLKPEECEALLRADVVGRIAFCDAVGPHVIPVNYSVVDDAIVVRTAPYTALAVAAPEKVAAFEIDQFDHANQRGWSVLARGRAELVDDPEDVAAIEAGWSPRPWASGVRSMYLRLAWTELTGRRLGRGWDPLEDLPVRRTV